MDFKEIFPLRLRARIKILKERENLEFGIPKVAANVRASALLILFKKRIESV